MNRHFTLLGHCDVTLGIILDSLFSLYDSKLEVDIVSNLTTHINPRSFLHDQILTKEVYYSDWEPKKNTQYLLTGMSPKVKRIIFEFFLEHFSIDAKLYSSVIHNSSVLCNAVTLEGAVNISPMTVVAQYATLGKFVTLNRNVSVGHHTEIGDYTTINPGCNLGGSSKIGKDVTIGIGSTIFDNIEIGDNVIIGGGSVVTKSVPSNTLVYGVPAKVIKTLE